MNCHRVILNSSKMNYSLLINVIITVIIIRLGFIEVIQKEKAANLFGSTLSRKVFIHKEFFL